MSGPLAHLQRAVELWQQDRLRAMSVRIEIGRELRAARQYVPKGHWEGWCHDNLPFSIASAYVWMSWSTAKDPLAHAVMMADRANVRALNSKRAKGVPPRKKAT